MDLITIGLIGMGFMFLLLLLGMPIAFAMGLVGFVGYAVIRGLDPALFQLQNTPFTTFSASYPLTCVPLFILMGELVFHSGISSELYQTVHHWLGRLRGGLAMATIGACAMFGAVCGSSAATVATMGTVSLPEMKRFGYDIKLATGTVAAGGGLGILIPPSIILVIYGLIASQSIGRLFLAGFVPGVLKAILYMITIYTMCRFVPSLGPRGPKVTFTEKLVSLKSTAPILALFVLVIGGIYLGVFTPTEASGVGAFGAFIYAMGRRSLTRSNFFKSLLSTCRTTSFILLIVLGANILGYFLTISKLPRELAAVIYDWETNRYIIMAGIMIVYIILGCVMEGLSIILLTVPIIAPLIQQLGFDMIWYGIVMVTVVEMGLITPPVGINVFIVKGLAPDVPMYSIFKGIIPFIIANIVFLALIITFPEIVTFLPTLMK